VRCLEGWLDDKIYKANLTLSNISRGAIHKLTNFKPQPQFRIALIIKLHEQQICPLMTNIKGLSWIGNICKME